MTERIIKYEVDASGIAPLAPQAGGVQGEHNATVVEFVVSGIDLSVAEGHSMYCRIDGKSGAGVPFVSEHLAYEGIIEGEVGGSAEVVSQKITYSLPAELTADGGVAQLRLAIVDLDSENNCERLMYSYPARIYFEDASGGKDVEIRRGISGMMKQAEDARDEAAESAEQATGSASAAEKSAEEATEQSVAASDAADRAEAAANAATAGKDAAELAQHYAEGFADSAEQSAKTAAEIAVEVEAMKGSAETSAIMASRSEGNTQTSERNALASEQNAAEYAATAEGHATDAEAAATEAASARDAAAQARDEAQLAAEQIDGTIETHNASDDAHKELFAGKEDVSDWVLKEDITLDVTKTSWSSEFYNTEESGRIVNGVMLILTIPADDTVINATIRYIATYNGDGWAGYQQLAAVKKNVATKCVFYTVKENGFWNTYAIGTTDISAYANAPTTNLNYGYMQPDTPERARIQVTTENGVLPVGTNIKVYIR